MPVMLLSDSRASVNEMFDAVIEWQIERAVDEEQLLQLHNICREASREVYGMLEARPGMTLELIEKLHLVLLARLEEMFSMQSLGLLWRSKSYRSLDKHQMYLNDRRRCNVMEIVKL